MSWKEEFYNLVATGSSSGNYLPEISDKTVEKSLDLLSKIAVENPDYYLETLLTVGELMVNSMTNLVIAIFLSKSPDDFLSNPKVKSSLKNLLLSFDARQLEQLVKLLKSRSFGKGLGSRNQKIIRSVMETWSVEDLKAFMISQSKSIYNLLRLIHPRFNIQKSEIIKVLLVPKN